MFYIRTADRLQRTAAWLESLDGGLDYLRVGDRGGLASASAPSWTRRWPGTSRATRTSGRPSGRPGEAAPVRVLRQRARHPRPEHRLRPRARPAAPGRPARCPVVAPCDDRDPVTWTPVCGYDDLQPERGVAALVGGEQVALFRTFDGSLYALGNQDPFSRGVRAVPRHRRHPGRHPTVASPLHKQVSTCAPAVPGRRARRVPVFPVRVRDGSSRWRWPTGMRA